MTLNEWAARLSARAGEGDEPLMLAQCHGDLADALRERLEGRPLVYCENMRHNPCEDCELLEGGCGSIHRESRPMGAGSACVRAVMRLLAYLGARRMDVEALMEKSLAWEEMERARARAEAEKEREARPRGITKAR